MRTAKVPHRPPKPLTKRAEDAVSFDGALWRIHTVAGQHPSRWDGLRTYGPIDACRYDPHPEPKGDHPGFGIAYTAADWVTCVAEVFQSTRLIVTSHDQHLSGWVPTRPLELLDLTGDWALRNRAASALTAARRSTCRQWSRAIRQTWPDLDGLWVTSTMTGKPMVVLYEPAQSSFPTAPAFRAGLAEPGVLQMMAVAARSCGYGLV